MQQIVLELPPGEALPAGLSGEDLLDALAVLRKLFGRRDPPVDVDWAQWDRSLAGAERAAERLESRVVHLGAALETLEQQRLATVRQAQDLRHTLSEITRTRPWVRSESSAQFAERLRMSTLGERRMLDAAVALSQLGPQASTRQLKEAVEGTIPAAVVQKEYNVPRVTQFMEQNVDYVAWYKAKREATAT